jgi:hypothetical protein
MSYTNLSVSLVLAVGLGAGVSAYQTTQPKTSSTKAPQTKSMTQAKTPTKLTGCIERGPAAAGSSTVVPPGNPPPPPMYKLTRVEGDVLRGVEKSRTAAGATPEPMTEISLRADSSINLSDHVNHKVDLTGKVVSAKPDPKASAQAGIAEVPVFQVTGLKMLSSTCQ